MKKIKPLIAVIVFATLNCSGQYTKILDFGSPTNASYPHGSLISDGTFLYGMSYSGGVKNWGTIFKIRPDGTGYTDLFDFGSIPSGGNPMGSLISDGTFLYGTTFRSIFKVKLDGTGYTTLYDFRLYDDGSNLLGSLFYDGTFLYGTTEYGGTGSAGTIFKIKPDGTSYSKLSDFDSLPGNSPYGSLISDGTYLYGTTSHSIYGSGTIFKIKPDGTAYDTLTQFTGANGVSPLGDLLYDGVYLYGMTSFGGINEDGIIFKIKPDGTGFTNLMDFDSIHGSNPYGSLISDGTYLYGMTQKGGVKDKGTIFKIKHDGTGYSKLLNFNGLNGSQPYGSLFFDGTFLYGMTYDGGPNALGNIFKIKPDGTEYTDMLDFNGAYGKQPYGSLVFDGTFLYGMTQYGGTNGYNNSSNGANGYGTIFKIKPDGTEYSKLLDFSYPNGNNPLGSLIFDGTFLYGMANNIFKIKTDGSGYTDILNFNLNLTPSGISPKGSLIYEGGFLYGMTSSGGTSNAGTIFKIKPDGTGYTGILDFNSTTGVSPSGSLFSDGDFLYGMANGGANGVGTIFKIKPDGTNYTDLLGFNNNVNVNRPSGSLISDGTFLYGMSPDGGTNGGIVFKIKPDGTSYTILKDNIGGYGSLFFDGNFLYGMDYGNIFKIKPDGTAFDTLMTFIGANGIEPRGDLISDSNFLYGMTSSGGVNNMGTIFKYYYCTTNCCYSHYITNYDAPNNIFTLKVDSITINLASSYHWDFGDGSSSTQATPTHNYTKDTTYNVCLKIKTSSGDSCSYCHTVGKDNQGNIYRTSGFILNVIGSTSTTTPEQTSIITNSSNESIFVFPNPTTGIIYLQGQLENAQIKICDLLGKNIYQNTSASSNLQIDLSSQPNGVYFISIQANERSVNKKIVISH